MKSEFGMRIGVLENILPDSLSSMIQTILSAQLVF